MTALSLREENEELREEVRQLREIFTKGKSFNGLSPMRAAIFTALEHRPVITGEEIAGVVTILLGRDVTAKAVNLAILRMRRDPKLAELSDVISSRPNTGYWLTPDNKARLLARRET